MTVGINAKYEQRTAISRWHISVQFLGAFVH